MLICELIIQTIANFIIFTVTLILHTFLRKLSLPRLLWRATTASETELANSHSLILKHNIGNSCIFMNRAISETSEHVCLTFALYSLEICWLKVPSKLADAFWYCYVTCKLEQVALKETLPTNKDGTQNFKCKCYILALSFLALWNQWAEFEPITNVKLSEENKHSSRFTFRLSKDFLSSLAQA